MNHPNRIRESAVAGSFYPADARKLRRDIESYLANVEAPMPDHPRPLVLIEPHAGYMYSGQVAAYGYKLIQGLPIKTVAVISPSHMEPFPFTSVFDGSGYDTPLGTLGVDTGLAAEIAAAHPDIRLSKRGHIQPAVGRQEHALEVQLPFLQTVLESFRIIPIMMGDQNWDHCEALGDAISPFLSRPDFLAVVSSDLSHFHSSDAARRMDARFCELVETMDAEGLYESIREGECEACGAGPVIAALIAARRAGASRARVLHAANSGDITGDHTNVVGYASAAVFNGRDRQPDPRRAAASRADETTLTDPEKQYLLDLARAFVELAVVGDAEFPSPVDSPRISEPGGAFVTLKIDGRLRGCIGTVEPTKSLRDTVAEMARAAALSDPRFAPLAERELADVDIEISVLTPPAPIRSAEDIRVGTHGLIVEKGHRRGLLLPQVATQYAWDAETFLEHTCEKAGLERDAWRDADTKIFIFSAEVFGR